MAVQELEEEEEVRDEDDHGGRAKEARVLNRIVRWHPRKGITYEADPRHTELISRDTGADAQDHLNTGCERNRTRSVKSTSPVTENHYKNGYVKYTTCTRTSS